MHQPLHNSHFLLLQVFFPAVANWLKLRSYICIQVSVSANLWNPEANLQCTRLGIVVLPLKVVAHCSTACGLPQNSMARYLSVSHCCQNDAIYHNLPPSTTNGGSLQAVFRHFNRINTLRTMFTQIFSTQQISGLLRVNLNVVKLCATSSMRLL
jgi:hypothetical protein